MLKSIKKSILAFLSGLLLITQIIIPQQIKAISTTDEEFQMFLSTYLENNYMIDKLDQLMLHQYFYEYLKEQNSLINTSITLTNLSNDLGYAMNGKIGLYENILLDLLKDYVNSHLFDDSILESKDDAYDQLFDCITFGIDFNEIASDYKELFNDLENNEKSMMDIVLNMPVNKVLDYTFQDLKNNFELPSNKDLLISGLEYLPTVMELFEEIVVYHTIKTQSESILRVYEQMYRNALNSELRVALKRIIDKFKAINDTEILKFIKKELSTSGHNLTYDVIQNVFEDLLSSIGIGIKTGGFLSEIIFKSDTLAKLQLMLEAELDIENEIKKNIRYMQNTYRKNIDNAINLNTSFMFLYEAYKYGMDLVENYNDAVFKAHQNVLQMNNPKEHLKNYRFYTQKEKEFANKKHEYERFKESIQLWNSIIKNDCTIFASAWKEYRQTYYLELEKKIEEYKSKVLISNIRFEKDNVTLNKDEITNMITYLNKPIVEPKGATNPILIYTSSDPSILSIPNARVYGVQLHKTGKVKVTAKTLDGTHTTTQIVTVVDNNTLEDDSTDESVNDDFIDEQPSNEQPVEPKYEYAYEHNDTGITLTSVIRDFVFKKENDGNKEYIFKIPEKIDGNTVTKIDFSKHSESLYNPITVSGVASWMSSYDITKIIFPSTIKEIADYGFYYKHSIDIEFVLNEGLETIGDYAFSHAGKGKIEIPSSVSSIGVHAFERSYFKTVEIQSEHLETIPEACFKRSKIEHLIIKNKDLGLKEIDDEAFYDTPITTIDLPDSIERLGKLTFYGATHLQINTLPANLIEIDDQCFIYSNQSISKIPNKVRKIGKEAFYMIMVSATGIDLSTLNIDINPKNYTYISSVPSSHMKWHVVNLPSYDVQLPNSIKSIGIKAFDNPRIKSIRSYGENEGNAIIEKGAFFIDGLVEIPTNVTKLDQPFSYVFGIENEVLHTHTREMPIIWTNGINEIVCENFKDVGKYIIKHCQLYLNQIERIGSYTINGHIFTYDEYYDYIEIPTNYLKNSSTPLEGKWMKEVVIIGDASQSDLERFVSILKGAIDDNGIIKYKDNQGNVSLLYENPKQSYSKVSQVYQDKGNYIVDEAFKLKKNTLNSSVDNLKAKLSYGEDIKTMLGNTPDFMIKLWLDEGESIHEKKQMIPNIIMFEDLYLTQPIRKYFELELLDLDNNLIRKVDDKFVISLEMNDLRYSKRSVALYHISDTGKITRLKLNYQETTQKCTITFETNQLGQFALVNITRTKEVIHSNPLDELYNKYTSDEHGINKNQHENNFEYIIKNNSSDVEIVEPNITDKIKEEIIEHVQMKEEKNEDVLNKAFNNLIEINTSKDNQEVQIVITPFENNNHSLHLFKVNENTLEDISEENIELNEHEDQKYYQCKLLKQGKYYFTITEDDKVEYHFIFILGGILILVLIGFVLVIKNNKS